VRLVGQAAEPESGEKDKEKDGRAARSERARAAVVDALLALIDEGQLQPTAQAIAQRAGVSLRLVFHHFDDLEALFIAASQRQLERMMPQVRSLPTGGSLEERLDASVEQRCMILEKVCNVRRAALLLEHCSPAAQQRLKQVRDWKRAEVCAVFLRELEALPARERGEVAAALAAASSFDCWQSLRLHQELSADDTRKVMKRMLRGLLARRSR
jgi:TetR/AcrR family transcriptional regulator, regulator of autoinduction and epiphytic fitness